MADIIYCYSELRQMEKNMEERTEGGKGMEERD
jgi:hypothetical protein